MRAKQGLTYQELIQLAKENYNNGGDGIVECWDETTFNEYVKMFGPITKKAAKAMFRTNKAVDDDRMGW